MERRKIRQHEGLGASRLFGFMRMVFCQPQAGFGKPALQLRYFDEDGLAFAFAALCEPSCEAFGKTSGGKAEAGLDAAIGDRERIVEIGGVGEIAHAELVEPVERTRLFLAEDDDIDRELLRVHASILALSF